MGVCGKVLGEKVIISVLAAGAVVAVILAVAAGSAGILERFTNISFGASTFLGRILYVQDALPLILKHPSDSDIMVITLYSSQYRLVCIQL